MCLIEHEREFFEYEETFSHGCQIKLRPDLDKAKERKKKCSVRAARKASKVNTQEHKRYESIKIYMIICALDSHGRCGGRAER